MSKALRSNYDKVAAEPLPERWVDLINHLNERMKAEQELPSQKQRRDR